MSEMVKIVAESEVNAASLSCILGITQRRIRQLQEDRIIMRGDSGNFNIRDTVSAYIDYLVQQAKPKKELSEEEKKLEKIKNISDAQLRKTKAEMASIELNEMQGKIHRAEDVEALTGELLSTLRSYLNALPGRLAVEVASVSTAPECADVIRKEVQLILKELSSHKYDRKKYAELVRERRKWETKEADDE